VYGVLEFVLHQESIMATITIDLPDTLTAQLARVSERASVTAHDFIVAAIAEK